MFTILVGLAVFVQVVIALSVYFRRTRGQTNTFFVLFSLAIASWALSDYVAISVPQNASAIYAIRTVLSFVVVQNILFYFFANTFPDKKISQLSHWWKPLLAYSLVVLILTQTPLIFSSVSIKGSTANPNAMPLIALFILQAVLTIVLGLRRLIGKYHQGSSLERRQLALILFAVTILVVIVPVTNFAITLLFNTTLFVRFAPFYTLFFAGIITYAIVAQKLFDVRAAVARSVAYLLILAAMVVTYGVGLFGVIDVLVRGSNHEFARQLLSLVLVTPLALSFQRIRQYFDRVTNRLFYRDAYETQDVLDKLGRVATTEIELYKILGGTRQVLGGTLKSSFIEFILIKNDKAYFEARTHRAISQELLSLSAHIREQVRNLLVADDMSSGNPLREHLYQAEVALSLRLRAHDQVVGYILFGQKRSGDIYSAQDKKLLRIAANELAVALQNALRFEEIQNFNLTLQAKVEEATHKARRVNDRLKALDEAKDDFVSMASHQLRTPLTSVKGYISMVLEGDAGKINATQRQLLEQSFASSQRMVYLIADLLNVSRLKTGKFLIEPKPTDLADVVDQEVKQLQETASSRQLTLDFSRPTSFPTLMLDETKTRQVVMNFIDNAIYYTPSGGHIEVTLTETPASVELRVKDDGIGVPKAEQHHLFTKFYRAGNARKARPDGTGLGLFMAKKVIVAQGGAIIFQTQEGKGSTFGFMFSKSKLAVPVASGTPTAVSAAETASTKVPAKVA